MSKIVRTAKYKLYPNKEQELNMLALLETSRRMYNHLLTICDTYLGFRLPLPTMYDLGDSARYYRDNYNIRTCGSCCIDTAAYHAHEAYKQFLRMIKIGEKTTKPRYKSRLDFNSFIFLHNNHFRFREDHHIGFANIGDVKYRNEFKIPGVVKTATILRVPMGDHYEWYAQITYNLDSTVPVKPEGHVLKCVGIDLGLKDTVVTSDGKIYCLENTYADVEKQLQKKQRRLEKLSPNTDEYRKIQGHISHIYKKIKNRRSDFLHKTSSELVREYDIIYLEKLNIAQMIDKSVTKTRKKEYRDSSWGLFINMLMYKAEQQGKQIVFVNPYNTSKICSNCGKIVEKQEKERTHCCPYCGITLHRDINGAINILNIGLGQQAIAMHE